MDKIIYRGKPTLLIDTDDITSSNRLITQCELNVKKMIKKYKLTQILIISSLPFSAIPCELRLLAEKSDEIHCYRMELQ